MPLSLTQTRVFYQYHFVFMDIAVNINHRPESVK